MTMLNIYFNEAGFDVNKKSEELEIQDEIKVEYSGVSGDVYSNGAEAIDTHELSILLPSIGNTISKVWDLIYKPDGEGNRDTIIQSDSLFDGVNYDMSTIAGCIRTAQDVLGQDMIKEGLPEESKYGDEYNNAYIYKQDGKYYIIVRKYNPVYSDTNELIAWSEDGYELKEINLNEPINSIFGAMAQLNQELDIAEEKIGAYFTHLDNAVKNLLTFKTFNFNNIIDENRGTQFAIEAQTLSDEITFATSGSLKFENDENVSKQVKLSLTVEQELADSEHPISSKVVKTEVDNITSLIGDVKAILEAINGQTVEPLIDYNDIAIDTEEILWD